jgi:hypothetical protein
LATAQTSPSLAALASSALEAISAEEGCHAALALPGTAACMALPLCLEQRAVSARLNAPAAAKREYSPSEWTGDEADACLSENPFSVFERAQ